MFQKVTVLSLQGPELTAPDQWSLGRGLPRPAPYYLKKARTIVVTLLTNELRPMGLYFDVKFCSNYLTKNRKIILIILDIDLSLVQKLGWKSPKQVG